MNILLTMLALRLGNPLGSVKEIEDGDVLNNYIAEIYPILMVIAALSAVLMIIFGGYKYITSEGDAKKLEEAKNTLMSAGTGLILIIIAALIVDLIGTGR